MVRLGVLGRLDHGERAFSSAVISLSGVQMLGSPATCLAGVTRVTLLASLSVSSDVPSISLSRLAPPSMFESTELVWMEARALWTGHFGVAYRLALLSLADEIALPYH